MAGLEASEDMARWMAVGCRKGVAKLDRVMSVLLWIEEVVLKSDRAGSRLKGRTMAMGG
jgi:hypothetical protein